jgi:hypothetical protein
MKANITILLALGLGLFAFGQKKPSIKGSRVVVQQETDLNAFHTVRLEDELEITLKKGGEGVFVNADDNLHELLNFDVTDSILTISCFYKIKGKKKLEINVSYKSLKKLHIIQGTLKTVSPIDSDKVSVLISDNGRFEGEVHGDLVTWEMKDNARAKAQIKADSLSLALTDKIVLDGVVDAQEIAGNLQGNAKCDLAGTVHSTTMQLHGNASARMERCIAEMAKLTLGGKSDVRVQANQQLNLELLGSSRTEVYGEPTITLSGFFDTAQLLKKN